MLYIDKASVAVHAEALHRMDNWGNDIAQKYDEMGWPYGEFDLFHLEENKNQKINGASF